ncbi:hypothetical protein BP6252_12464 [Coleophoma cylindrospora]|uniref:Uncharacterized protein n=1 Tax=Coleophoma cylindrospora TaxID=1849047 RepID=A0A3D8QH80_9HELO|nr:hypothetical protein BP6252_12464 [Coleophoma cylindrospora]
MRRARRLDEARGAGAEPEQEQADGATATTVLALDNLCIAPCAAPSTREAAPRDQSVKLPVWACGAGHGAWSMEHGAWSQQKTRAEGAVQLTGYGAGQSLGLGLGRGMVVERPKETLTA